MTLIGIVGMKLMDNNPYGKGSLFFETLTFCATLLLGIHLIVIPVHRLSVINDVAEAESYKRIAYNSKLSEEDMDFKLATSAIKIIELEGSINVAKRFNNNFWVGICIPNSVMEYESVAFDWRDKYKNKVKKGGKQ